MNRDLGREEALNAQHDYQVCMAQCPDEINCNCSPSGDLGGIGWLIAVLAFLIWPGVLIWGNFIVSAIENIKYKAKHKDKN